jgi:Tol biopolymer transport system component
MQLILLMALAVTGLLLGQTTESQKLFGAATHQAEVEGNLPAAIATFQKALVNVGSDRALAARILVQLGRCYEQAGNADARSMYERVVREFGDQPGAVADARSALKRLGSDAKEARQAIHKLFEADYYYPFMDSSSASADGTYLAHTTWEEPARRPAFVIRKLGSGTSTVFRPPNGHAVATSTFCGNEFIAYSMMGSGTGALRRVAVNGNADRLLHANSEWTAISVQDCARDHSTILSLISRPDRSVQVAVFPAAGGPPRIVKTFDWRRRPRRAVFSLNEDAILYEMPQADEARESDIYRLSLNGGVETAVVNHSANDQLAGWAPDGRLIFTSDRSGQNAFWAVMVGGSGSRSQAEVIKRDMPLRMRVLRITPSGKLLYGSEENGSAVYTAEIDPDARRLISPFRRLHPDLARPHGGPSYSPDGKYLAYIRRDSGQRSTVRIVNVQSGAVREMVPKALSGYSLEWGPDSQALVIGWDDRFGFGLYVLNLLDGEHKLLVRDSVYNNPHWAPDGKTAIYATDKGTFRVDIATTRVEQISSTPKEMRFTHSGNRALAAFAEPKTPSTVVEEINRDGGSLRRITTREKAGNIVWANENSILVTDRSPAGQLHLVLVDAATGQQTDLGPSGSNGLVKLRVSPDGRRIVASDQFLHGEFWSVDNLLPKAAARP